MVYRILFFIVLNFAALAVGSYYTSDGVPSEWYANLNKAPWTPPGWVFGFAWTTIMICFAIYMAFASKEINTRGLYVTFALQWILNVVWNPIFFYSHNVSLGLVVISALTILIIVMLYHYWSKLKQKSLWLAPYVIWMLIATSLNAYIFFEN